MIDLGIAYHEAAHAVLATQTINLTYKLKLEDNGNSLGFALQKFQIQRFMAKDINTCINDMNKNQATVDFIKKHFKGYILTVLAGQQAECIYRKLAPKIIPVYLDFSDDLKFAEALEWYCKIFKLKFDYHTLRTCYSRVNTELYNVLLQNSTLWTMIENLANKLFNAKNQELSGFKTMLCIYSTMFRLAYKSKYLPQFNLNLHETIEDTCR